MKKEIYPDYDWEKIPTGSVFSAIIEYVNCKGRVYNSNGEVYLCQNKKMGSDSPDKLGFKHSWTIRDGDSTSLQKHEVRYLEVWLDPTYRPKIPRQINGYNLTITKEEITVGCTPVLFELVELIYKKMKQLRREKL